MNFHNQRKEFTLYSISWKHQESDEKNEKFLLKKTFFCELINKRVEFGFLKAVTGASTEAVKLYGEMLNAQVKLAACRRTLVRTACARFMRSI